jgi:hypothetical protein
MFDSKYYLVRIQMKIEDSESGKIKKHKESYLVNAVSVTDAEVKVAKDFSGTDSRIEWEVVSVTETKILKVL